MDKLEHDDEQEHVTEEHDPPHRTEEEKPVEKDKLTVDEDIIIQTGGIYIISLEDLVSMDHLALSTCDNYFDEDQEAFRLHIIKTLMDIVAVEMQRLSPAQRDIIEMHFLMDRKIADIERVLGVGSQSLIDRRNRAIAILRARLCSNPLVMDLYNKLDDPEDFPLLKNTFLMK